VLGQSWVYGWCADRQATFNQVVEEVRIALSLDDNDSDVHRVLAASNLTQGEHDKAYYHQQRALHLNPNDDLIVVQQGEILTWIGEPESGIPWIQKAMRLNPFHPPRFWNHLGRAYFVARRYADAVEAFKRIGAPDQFHHAFLAACHAQLGDSAATGMHAKEVLARNPGFNWSTTLAPTLYYKRDGDVAHHREAVEKAGLPG
jgi:adenylate cyclase